MARIIPASQALNRFLLYSFFHIHVYGEDNWPHTDKGLILAPKHCSRWDPLLLALLSPRPLRFVATTTEFKGLQGWFMRRLGAIPIDREQTKPSSIYAMVNLLQAGEPVVIFPEGGIRDHLGPLKPGLGRMAVNMERKYQLALQVLPIVIRYSPAAVRGATVEILILPPLQVSQFMSDASLPADPQQDKQVSRQLTQALQQALASAWSPSQGSDLEPPEPRSSYSGFEAGHHYPYPQ
ncbi:MAG: 1-acyl-sn-glycerol-3-phosphate acyltransferase [Synechococcaceae cyanobacterium SM2_3_1]|nr:1-acyl-sn-glycerol-3-phosphate acyltransferase [Synechococcaceae cyanobacterium SM2_3_1]